MDFRDENGMTALHYACEGESPMSIISLVQAGCDAKTPAGPKGKLPIDFAVSHQLKHVRPIKPAPHPCTDSKAVYRLSVLCCGIA